MKFYKDKCGGEVMSYSYKPALWIIVYQRNYHRVKDTSYFSTAEDAWRYIQDRLGNSRYLIPYRVDRR